MKQTGRSVRAWIGGILLGVFLAAGAAYLGRDRLVQEVLRPLLVRAAAERLGVRVALAGLALGARGAALTALRIEGEGGLRVAIPRVECALSWPELLRGRVARIRLGSPWVEVGPLPEGRGASAPEAPPAPPSPLPLEVERLEVEGGTLLLRGEDRLLRVEGLRGEVRGTAAGSFRVQGRVGAGRGLPFAVRGRHRWGRGLSVTAEELSWNGRQLLAAPLTVQPLGAGGALRLERFDDAALAGVLGALDLPNPLPPGWHFDAAQAELGFRRAEGELSVDLAVPELLVRGGGGVRAAVTDLRAEAARAGARWTGRARFRLGEGVRVQASGELGGASPAGRATVEVAPPPGAAGEAAIRATWTRGAQGRLEGTLETRGLDGGHLDALARAAGVGSPLPPGLRVAAGPLRAEWRLTGERLAVRGEGERLEAARETVRLPLRAVRFEARLGPEGGEGSGTFALPAGGRGEAAADYRSGRLEATFAVDVADVGRLAPHLLGGEPLPLRGGLRAQGEIRRGGGGLRVAATLRGTPAAGPPEGYWVDLSPLGARIEARDLPGATRWTAAVELAGRPVGTAEGTARSARFRLGPLSGEGLQTVASSDLLPGWVRGAEGLSASGRLRREPRGGWTAEVAGGVERVAFEDLRLLGVRLEGEGRFRDPLGTARVALAAARLEGRGLQAGPLSAGGQARLEDGRLRWELQSAVAEGIEYLSPDGMAGLSGGHLRVDGRVRGEGAGGELALDLSAAFGCGEVLYGAFYAHTSELEATGRVDGAYRRGRLEARALEVGADALGRLEFRGGVGPDGIRGEVAARTAPLDGPAAGYLRAALAALGPAWEGLEPSGALGIAAAVDGGGGRWRARGEVEPRGLGLRWPRWQVAAEGCTGRLPFDLGSAGEAAPAEGERPGEVRCEALQVGPARLATPAIPVEAGPNRFRIPGAVAFDLAGGRATAADLEARLGSAGPAGTAAIRIQGVDLGRLTAALGVRPVSGTANADLGRIRYEKGAVTTDGEAVVEAFGGVIRVRNIRLQDPASPYATFHGDLDIEGLDLHRLTATFAFGEMNGVVDGYVHDLRWFGKVPSRFRAALATRNRGRRTISVKALRNLSILSQGGLSAALSRGIYRFIDFYRYKKIGIFCTLENDVFYLEGTARPGSDRYLVYGGLLPPKIDILAPARAVSFQEMVRRLSRLERAGQ